MKVFSFMWRRPLIALLLLTGLVSGIVIGSEEMGYKLVSQTNIDFAMTKVSAALLPLGFDIPKHLEKPGTQTLVETRNKDVKHPEDKKNDQHGQSQHSDAKHEDSSTEGGHHVEHRMVVTSPKVMDVKVIQPYVCQIHSRRHIEVCALEKGYLEEILVKEGQAVKKGDLLFKILPVLYQARFDAEVAEAKLAELEYNYTKTLADKNVVSSNEVLLLEAKLAKAKANVKIAQAELNFTNVIAPFDGIVDRLHEQIGSLIAEGDMLTTLSDNSVMWVYFNVPEAAYLDYMENQGKKGQEERIDLILANGRKFPEAGKIGAIEAKFNNQTGNIPFRADFDNPERLLRHGQTGTIQITRVLRDVVVIPQRATFEVLDKRYVFVVDEKNIAHQRLITIQGEKDDIFIIKTGLSATEKFVLDGARDVRDGTEIHFETESPDNVLKKLKYHAE